MKYFCASMAFFLSLALGSVQAATYQPLLEATELSEALAADQQLQIIDIRSAEDYAAGHIPGAISAPYGQWRGPSHNPGQLADNLYFETLVRQLVLTDQQPIVVFSSVVDETDFVASARVYMTLNS